MKVWICAIAKMEELYIREWIEWHKNIGFDHIIIGDNNNSNYDKPLCPIIQDYIDSGFVEVINQNNLFDCQIDCYNLVFEHRKNEFDWITFIDIDEFIELPAYNNNVKLFLNDNKFSETDSIILPWACYGDNDKLYYEDKPVKERFTKKIKQFRTGIKFFIKSKNEIEAIYSVHSPLNCRTINCNDYKVKCCDSLGNFDFKPVLNSYHSNDFWIVEIYTKDEYYNNAYISHYITKSTEEFIKYKILRGRPDRSIDNYEIRYNINFYYWLNCHTQKKDELFESYNVMVDNSELRKKILNNILNNK